MVLIFINVLEHISQKTPLHAVSLLCMCIYLL